VLLSLVADRLAATRVKRQFLYFVLSLVVVGCGRLNPSVCTGSTWVVRVLGSTPRAQTKVVFNDGNRCASVNFAFDRFPGILLNDRAVGTS